MRSVRECPGCRSLIFPEAQAAHDELVHPGVPKIEHQSQRTGLPMSEQAPSPDSRRWLRIMSIALIVMSLLFLLTYFGGVS